eukprot:COSAG01_NODE_16869_length_1197_cov_2.552823_1_plen_132_part_00
MDGTALAHGLWTAQEREHHITVLELVAVLRNLEAFLPRLRGGGKIHLHEDNQAVVYILRRVTSRSPILMRYLRQLWHLMQTEDISFAQVDYIGWCFASGWCGSMRLAAAGCMLHDGCMAGSCIQVAAAAWH